MQAPTQASMQDTETTDGRATTHTGSAVDPDSRELAARIRQIIDKYDHGNVSQAARRLAPFVAGGVSQRGLTKVYNGETTDPHASLVQAVLLAYPGEDPRWVLTGEEEPVEERIERRARVHAHAMLSAMLEGLADETPATVVPADGFASATAMLQSTAAPQGRTPRLAGRTRGSGSTSSNNTPGVPSDGLRRR
jgi:hypothetical protein